MDINATLLVESVIFLGFVSLTMKYVWPPILAVLQERQLHIEQGLRNADQAKQTLDEAHSVADHIVHQAKHKADEIIEEAQTRAHDLVNSAKLASDEHKRQTELELVATQEKLALAANKKLRQKTSQFCIAICQKILGEKSISGELEKKVTSYFTNELESL